MGDNEFLRNVLTLRYHPSGVKLLPDLSWRDFTEIGGVELAVSRTLEGVIRHRLAELNIQDNDIGMGVSGGVDSSTVLALIKRVSPSLKIRTYCVTFGEDEREVKAAQEISELYGTEHRHIVVDNPLSDLERLVKIAKSPRWNLYPYYLFEAAKHDGCRVLVTGDGGDEMFGGYVFRYRHMLSSRVLPLTKRYLEAHQMDWVPDQKQMFTFPFKWSDIYRVFERGFRNPLPLLGKVFLADYHGKLMYDFAPTAKAFAEHCGIEYFAPMLDPACIYVASHVPYHLKYDYVSNTGKILLRQILIETSGLKPASGGKIGWGGDMRNIWGYAKTLCDPENHHTLYELDIVSKEWCRSAYSKACQGETRYISKMLGIYAAELYLRSFMSETPESMYDRLEPPIRLEMRKC